jgi:hypothetical protein
MTPQELIDMPGYGSAKRELIKQGQWHVCVDDTERIEWIAACAGMIKRGRVHGFWIVDCETDEEFDPEHLRDAIDTAARSDVASLPL